jgi:hypothetical protein
MEKTAVEWFFNELQRMQYFIGNDMLEAYKQAKAMEKEQIIDSFVECWKENMPEGYECKQSAEYYYNETFKQD